MDDARSAKVNQSKCLILSLLHRCGSAADAASKASATVATHTTRGKRHGATISVPKLNVALCRPGRRASDLRGMVAGSCVRVDAPNLRTERSFAPEEQSR